MPAVDPNRANRMDDIFCPQTEGFCLHSLARCDLSDLLSGGQQLFFPGRFVNGAIRAAAYLRLWIGRVDDRVSLDLCYIVSDDLKGP